MPAVNLKFVERTAIVELNRPKAHAMNLDMVQELHEALVRLESADYIHGVIITAQGSIFCAGLDLLELYDYDVEELERFWGAFHNLLHDLAGFTKPMVAAINGHAIAGGCVLALMCDHRIMVEGNGRIGLNEVPVGLIVPSPVVELTRFVMGQDRANRMLLNGTLFDVGEASQFGLVDDHCPPGELMVWAQTRLDKWLALSPTAWRKTKEFIRAPLVAALDIPFQEGYGPTLKAWWDPTARKHLNETVDRLRSSKAKA